MRPNLTLYSVILFGLLFLVGIMPTRSNNISDVKSIYGVVVDKSKNPIEGVLVITSGKNIKDTVSSSISGLFETRNLPDGDYKISLKKSGYIGQEYRVPDFAGMTNLDTIILQSSDYSLRGATIKGKRQVFENDRRIIYPSQKQKENTADGLSLLSRLDLPAVSILPGIKYVKYWRGRMVFYINDYEASKEQVIALSPKDVVRVEYIDKPADQYSSKGEIPDLVIKIITKKYVRGVFNSIGLTKLVNRSSGSADLENRIVHGANEYSVDYSGNYDKSKRSDKVVNKQQYFFDNGTILKKKDETRHFYDGSYYSNRLSWMFYHRKPDDVMTLRLQYSDQNSPKEKFLSRILYSGVLDDTTHRINYNSKNEQNFSFNFSYNGRFTKKLTYFIDADYNYAWGHSNDRQNENTFTDDTVSLITNNGHSKSQSAYGSFSVCWDMNKNWTWWSYLSDRYNYAHNDYVYENLLSDNASRSRLLTNTTWWRNYWMYKKGRFSNTINVEALLKTEDNHQAYDRTRLHTNLRDYGRYTLKDESGYIGYDASFRPLTLGLKEMNTGVVQIDRYTFRQGNPNLKEGYSINTKIAGSKEIGPVEANAFIEYCFYHNIIGETVKRTENLFYRMPENFNTHAFNSELEAAFKLAPFFMPTVAIGYNKYWNHNRSTRESFVYDNVYFRFRVMGMIKSWMFGFMGFTHNNDMYGETMGTSGRLMAFTLQKTWLKGDLSTTLNFYNPFSRKYSKEGEKSYSRVAPYTYWTYKKFASRALELNVIYKISWGKRTSNKEIKTDVDINNGQITTSQRSTKTKEN